MCSLVKMFLDYLYQELGERDFEVIAHIPPGLKVLKNANGNLFDHPHVVLWHRFLLRYFDPRLCYKPYAIIMPCSSTKPYRLSATHRIVDSIIFKNGLDKYVQLYVLSEPMILVPRELDIYYPFANYDYPIEELTPQYRERFLCLLSLVLPKLRHYKKVVAVLPRHHLSILVEGIKRAGTNLNIDIIEYGKRAFHSVKLATSVILDLIKGLDHYATRKPPFPV